VRIFLFTNTLIDVLPSATEVFKRQHVDKCLEILNKQEDLKGLSKSEIYAEIDGNQADIRKSLDILEHFKKISPIGGRGTKLEFL
jgi:hypothetical protein